MVFAQALAEVLIPACVAGLSWFFAQVEFLGVLLQVCNVMCGVSSLEDRICSLGLLLALPEEVLAKTNGQFCGEHIPTRCPGRKSKLMGSSIGGGHNYRLCSSACAFGN